MQADEIRFKLLSEAVSTGNERFARRLKIDKSVDNQTG